MIRWAMAPMLALKPARSRRGDIVGPAHQEDRVRVLPDQQQIGQDGQHTAGGVAVDTRPSSSAPVWAAHSAVQTSPPGGRSHRSGCHPGRGSSLSQGIDGPSVPGGHKSLARASLTVGWGWIAWISSSAVPSRRPWPPRSHRIMSVTC